MTALPETGREIPADPMAKIRREVDRVNEQSADQYDEWMAERGVTTSRAEWKRRALAAEARLASLDAERARTVEECARVAEGFGKPYALHTHTGAMMFRACTENIAKAIRALASEKGGPA